MEPSEGRIRNGGIFMHPEGAARLGIGNFPLLWIISYPCMKEKPFVCLIDF
jgi:hypothetical protein